MEQTSSLPNDEEQLLRRFYNIILIFNLKNMAFHKPYFIINLFITQVNSPLLKLILSENCHLLILTLFIHHQYLFL